MKPTICPMCRSNIEIDKHILNKIRFNQYYNRLSRLKNNILSNGMHIINNIIYSLDNEIISNIDEQLALEHISNNEPIIEDPYFRIENDSQSQVEDIARLREEQIIIMQQISREMRIFKICITIFVILILVFIISIGAL